MTQQTNKPDIAQELTTIYTTPKPSPEFVNKLERQLMREALNQSTTTTNRRSWFSLEALFAGWGMKTAVSLTILTLVVWLGTSFIQQNAVSAPIVPDGETVQFIAIDQETPADMVYGFLTEQDNFYPIGEHIINLEISPDEQYIAYTQQLGQELDSLEVFIMQIDGQGKQQITNNGLHDFSQGWSPSGRYLLFRTDLKIINIFDRETRDIQTITGIPETIHSPSWGFTDNQLLFSVETAPDSDIFELVQYDMQTGEQTTLLSDVFPLSFYWEWSDNRRKLLVPDRVGGAVTLIEADGSQTIFDNNREYFGLQGDKVIWSPDNETFAFTLNTGNYYRIHLMHAGSERHELLIDQDQDYPEMTTNKQKLEPIDWSPDGKSILMSAKSFGEVGNTQQYLYMIETGELLPLSDGVYRTQWLTLSEPQLLSWIPEGETPEFIIRQENEVGINELAILTNEGNVYTIVDEIESDDIALSPNGRYIAYQQLNNVFIIDLATQKTTHITVDEQMWRSMEWSPSSRYLLYETTLDTSNIFDTRTGQTKTITFAKEAYLSQPIQWGETDQSLLIQFRDERKGEFIQYNLRTNEQTTLNTKLYLGMTLSPNRSKFLIQDTTTNTLYVFTIKDEDQQTIHLDDYGFVADIKVFEKWLPDNERFLVDYDHKIYIFHLDGREPELVVDYAPQFVFSDNIYLKVIDWSPDNDALLVQVHGDVSGQYLYSIENESWQLLPEDIIYLGWWPQPK